MVRSISTQKQTSADKDTTRGARRPIADVTDHDRHCTGEARSWAGRASNKCVPEFATNSLGPWPRGVRDPKPECSFFGCLNFIAMAIMILSGAFGLECCRQTALLSRPALPRIAQNDPTLHPSMDQEVLQGGSSMAQHYPNLHPSSPQVLPIQPHNRPNVAPNR